MEGGSPTLIFHAIMQGLQKSKKRLKLFNYFKNKFFSDNKTFTVKKSLCDESGQILILEKLINFCNANTESEYIQAFNELNMLLSNLDIGSEKHIIFAGDINLFLDHPLDAKGGSPSLKKKTLFK